MQAAQRRLLQPAAARQLGAARRADDMGPVASVMRPPGIGTAQAGGGAVEARARSAGGIVASRCCGRPSTRVEQEAGRHARQHLDAPVDAGQRRRDDARERVVVEAAHRDVAGDVEAELGARVVHGVGDGVGLAEDRRRPLLARRAGAAPARARRPARPAPRVTVHSRPSVSAHSRTARLGRAVVGGLDRRCQHRHAPVAEAVQVAQHGADAARGCRRPPRPRWPRRAARRRSPPPAARRRSPPSPRWSGRWAPRAGRRRAGRRGGARGRARASASAVGVGHQRMQVAAAQLALQRVHESLVPEVGQAADEHADDPRRSRRAAPGRSGRPRSRAPPRPACTRACVSAEVCMPRRA